MKALVFLMSVVLGGGLGAVRADEAASDTKNQVIVIQDPTGRSNRRVTDKRAVVETGTDSISGSPEESIKAAYRTWEAACKSWKDEMRRLNGKTLIQASCGSPKRSSEIQASQKFYTYESQARFKVRVGGR